MHNIGSPQVEGHGVLGSLRLRTAAGLDCALGLSLSGRFSLLRLPAEAVL